MSSDAQPRPLARLAVALAAAGLLAASLPLVERPRADTPAGAAPAGATVDPLLDTGPASDCGPVA